MYGYLFTEHLYVNNCFSSDVKRYMDTLPKLYDHLLDLNLLYIAVIIGHMMLLHQAYLLK